MTAVPAFDYDDDREEDTSEVEPDEYAALLSDLRAVSCDLSRISADCSIPPPPSPPRRQ